MMNVVIPTIGTRGDIQPYIALALGLVKAWHTATLATHPCMRGLVESYGVDFAPIGPDIDIGREAARIRAKSPHWMLGFMRVMRFSFAMLDQSHTDVLALCRNWQSATTGWNWDPQLVPRFKLPKDLPLKQFHDVGHFVFNPGGVPTAMITAWYITREILQKENLS